MQKLQLDRNSHLHVESRWVSLDGKSQFRGILKRGSEGNLTVAVTEPQGLRFDKQYRNYSGNVLGSKTVIKLLDLPSIFNEKPLRVAHAFVNSDVLQQLTPIDEAFIPVTGLGAWLSALAPRGRLAKPIIIASTRMPLYEVEIGLRNPIDGGIGPTGFLRIKPAKYAKPLTAPFCIAEAQKIVTFLSYLSGSVFELIHINFSWHEATQESKAYFFATPKRYRYRRTDLNPERLEQDRAASFKEILQTTLSGLLDPTAADMTVHLTYFLEATNTISSLPLENIFKFQVLITSFEGVLHARCVSYGVVKPTEHKTLHTLLRTTQARWCAPTQELVATHLVPVPYRRNRVSQTLENFRTNVADYRNELLHGRVLNSWEDFNQEKIKQNLLPVLSALHFFEVLTYLGADCSLVRAELARVRDRVYQQRHTESIRIAASGSTEGDGYPAMTFSQGVTSDESV